MLYIHTLKDLNLKSADIEATYLVRELKQKETLPLSQEKLLKDFQIYFVSKTDLEAMDTALTLIPKVMEDIKSLPKNKEIFELINLERAYTGLSEIPTPLKKSIYFNQEIATWQEDFVAEITDVLNRLAKAKSKEEKAAQDVKISAIFEKLLRNKESFRFNFMDIVNEAQLARMNDLNESMSKGYFFHVKLDEYLKKQDMSEIYKRIPKEHVDKVMLITKDIKDIRNAVQRAYDTNMRIVNWSVIFYTYVKWLR